MSMILLRLRVATLTTRCKPLKSNERSAVLTKAGNAMDARLHTATSSGALYSTISVHRLLHLMVPRFCWFDLRLHASLYSMYGVPVSICASRMAYHNFWALIVLRAFPSCSNFV